MADAARVSLTVSRLLAAIRDHKHEVEAAGTVRVDSRDAPKAERKHAADRALWSLLDEALIEEARIGLKDAQQHNARKWLDADFDESRWCGPID